LRRASHLTVYALPHLPVMPSFTERLQEARTVVRRFQSLLADLDTAATISPPLVSLAPGQLLPQPAAKWRAADFDFYHRVVATERAVAAALCDDFDTPTAMRALLDLVTATRAHLAAAGAAAPSQANGDDGDGSGSGVVAGAGHSAAIAATSVPAGLLFAAADALRRNLRLFGLKFADDAGVPVAPSVRTAGGADTAAVTALLAFRQQVRGVAGALTKAAKVAENVAKPQAGDGTAPVQPVVAAARAASAALLQQCDAVRDTTLPALGLVLKDTPGGPVVTRA
jgi:cysteinyl-tRNA synthetase